MSQTASSFKQQKSDAGVARIDMKFEVAIVPVSDVDRTKEFYARLGWRLDGDVKQPAQDQLMLDCRNNKEI